MSQAKILDFEGAMDRVDGDLGLYFELIDMFLEDVDSNLTSLSDSINRGDAGQVESIAHSMKSALGNLGGMSSFEAAFALEKSGRAKNLSNAEVELSAFKSEIEKFKSAVAEKRN